VITVEDLLRPDRRWREYASLPEMDPLTEDDALQEAQLLDVRFDALRSTVGLLFELRTALQLRGQHGFAGCSGGPDAFLDFRAPIDGANSVDGRGLSHQGRWRTVWAGARPMASSRS
jgi:hypothetical protein